jgi:Zn-finger nucleic acid-binding protein
MKCPRCKATLNLSYRDGVEIDYCSECRGVWLDRGELDKLLVRLGDLEQAREREQVRLYDEDDERFAGGRRRGRNFLGDLFDFG